MNESFITKRLLCYRSAAITALMTSSSERVTCDTIRHVRYDTTKHDMTLSLAKMRGLDSVSCRVEQVEFGLMLSAEKSANVH